MWWSFSQNSHFKPLILPTNNSTTNLFTILVDRDQMAAAVKSERERERERDRQREEKEETQTEDEREREAGGGGGAWGGTKNLKET
jgi:hypothetical protein